MQLIDAMSWIIDEPSGMKILKESSICTIFYHLGYKFGLDDEKLSSNFKY